MITSQTATAVGLSGCQSLEQGLMEAVEKTSSVLELHERCHHLLCIFTYVTVVNWSA